MVDDDDTRQHPHRPAVFKPGNVDEDGNYVVGKNKPPRSTQFAAGDGRRRGRRPKGQRNFETEFQEEAGRTVIVRENGKERKVTKLRSTIVRAFDNAGAKGQHQAIATIFAHSARIADKVAPPSQGLTADEDAMVNAWIAQRLASFEAGDKPGDPDDPADEADESQYPDNAEEGLHE